VRSFLALALFTASAAFGDGQCIPTSRSPRIETFAAVKAIANQGEAGSELRLRETGNQVTATLRDYLGSGKLIETQLAGTLTQTEAGACKVHLSGRNKNAQVEIDGEITITRFQGRATRHVGKEVFSHAISLRRQLPNDTPEVGLSPGPRSFRHYCMNSAGRPVRRSIRFAIGGWVEKRLPKFIPSNGWMMNKCAVEGVAAMGTRRE
jgi:hypothetical protein